jgi:hypothetical protein
MGLLNAAAILIAIVVALIIFFVSFNWFSAILAFGILGILLALGVAAVLGWLAYHLVLRIWGAAKSP